MAEFENRSTDPNAVRVDGRPVTGAPAGAPVVERTVVRDRTNNSGWLIALLIIVALVVAAFAFKLINIDQTASGSLPTVKVDTAGGSLPKFNVDTAKVDVGTKTDTVKVPTVSVGTKETGIKVPTIHVEKADASPADAPLKQ